MNSEIIYCNVCFKSWRDNNSLHFFLTSCGKVICKNCLSHLTNCNKCGSNCSRKIINNQMGQDTKIFFADTATLKKRIMNAEAFQQNRYKQLYKYFYKKSAYLELQLQERRARIQTLEEQNNALDISVKKLKESYHYTQQKTHNSNSRSPSNTRFVENVLDAINEQIAANDSTAMSNSNSGIFPRGNVSISDQFQAPTIYQTSPFISAGPQRHTQIPTSYKGYNGRNQRPKSVISNFTRTREATSRYFK